MVLTVVFSQLTAVAVPLQVYDITGSSAYVGLAGAAGLVPFVVCGLWGGAIADAHDRRRVLLVTSVGTAVTSGLLWAQAAASLDSVVVLLVLVAVQQAFFGLHYPARNAAVARVLPEQLLTAGNTLVSTVGNLCAVAGPLLAGVLLIVVAFDTLYLLDALALCAATWWVWRLPALPPLRVDGTRLRARARDVVDAVGLLRGRPAVVAVLVADAVAMVLGLPIALFPEIAHEKFGDPSAGGFAAGVLFAAIPLGAVIAGLVSGTFTRTRRHGAMVTVGVCAWGLAVACAGLTGSLWWAAFFLVVGGAAECVFGTFRKTIMQTAVTDDMRGRIQGLDVVVAAGGPRLAIFVHGAAGAVVGTTWAMVAGGLLTVVGMLAVVAAFPGFWAYRASPPPIRDQVGAKDSAS